MPVLHFKEGLVYKAQLKYDTCKFLIINYTSHHLMYNTGIVYITNYTSHNLDSNTCIAYIKNYINHTRHCNIVRGVRRKGHVPKPVVCLGGYFRTKTKISTFKGAGEWKASLEQEIELYFSIRFHESSEQATTVWNILNTKPNHISNERLYYTTAAPPRQLSLIVFIFYFQK